MSPLNIPTALRTKSQSRFEPPVPQALPAASTIRPLHDQVLVKRDAPQTMIGRFVVPEIERRQILAASFSSQKFDGRAPEGRGVHRRL